MYNAPQATRKRVGRFHYPKSIFSNTRTGVRLATPDFLTSQYSKPKVEARCLKQRASAFPAYRKARASRCSSGLKFVIMRRFTKRLPGRNADLPRRAAAASQHTNHNKTKDKTWAFCKVKKS